MYGGYLLSSSNMVNTTATSFHYLMFSSPQMLPHHSQYNLMAHQSTMGFHHHFLFGAECNPTFCHVRTCCCKATNFSSKSAGSFWQNKVLWQRQNPFLNITYMCAPTHPHIHTPRISVILRCVIWQVPMFYIYHLTYNQNTSFSF
jgi:hypothetical protein